VQGLAARLLAALGHEPTEGQLRAADALERLMATDRENATLVLKGYAGTGKTSLVGALVKVLASEKRPVVLMAPTGRAAKVLGAYARHFASTIHRRIYRISGEDQGSGATVSAHKDEGALFIVDEASMIGRSGGDGAFGPRDLLEDLFEHVFTVPGCRLLLIGDPAQLPPVGSDHSPALETKDLKAMGLTAGVVQLTEVVRQAEESGILVNATALRAILQEEKPMPLFISGHDDVQRIDGYDLQDALEDAYSREGADEVCLICRSNKRAYEYSMQVRTRIYGYEEELSGGDRLMVVKNNYFWAAQQGRPELIANGETIQVKRVGNVEERFGLRFCDITASWWNGVEERELEAKVMLDVLASNSPALPTERQREFKNNVLQSFTARTRGQLYRMLKEDPFVNALQVKYAYAVTAHKAQGGQWNTVFVDQGYVTEEMIDREYVRWLYTAVTRASKKLYLLNFHGRFWGEE
jgi:exodeoxyribonuclease V